MNLEQHKFWDGEQLEGILGFDTETVSGCDITKEIPELVLASVCDADQAFIIRREHLARFLAQHEGCEFAGHNLAAFDFWVVDQWLRRTKASERPVWWLLAHTGKIHDTMLLDQLVRLARGDGEKPTKSGESPLPARKLDVLAEVYCPELQVSKDEPYRLRYHELLQLPNWGLVDPGFFTYALKDAVAARLCYLQLSEEARRLQQPFLLGDTSEIYPLTGQVWALDRASPGPGGHCSGQGDQERHGCRCREGQTSGTGLEKLTRTSLGRPQGHGTRAVQVHQERRDGVYPQGSVAKSQRRTPLRGSEQSGQGDRYPGDP